MTHNNPALDEIAPNLKLYIENLSNSIILYAFLLRFKNIDPLDFKESYIGGCIIKLLNLSNFPKNAPKIIKACCIFLIKFMQHPWFESKTENQNIFLQISEALKDFSPLIQFLGGINYQNLCKINTLYLINMKYNTNMCKK